MLSRQQSALKLNQAQQKNPEEFPRLAVFVDIAPKASNKSLKGVVRLRFECTSAQVVIVSVERGPADVLQELFPGDLGKWPSESLEKQMRGQPYYWVQVLAGQSHYFVIPDRRLLEGPGITTMEVITRIRSRLSGGSD